MPRNHCVSADGCVQSQWPETEISNSGYNLSVLEADMKTTQRNSAAGSPSEEKFLLELSPVITPWRAPVRKGS